MWQTRLFGAVKMGVRSLGAHQLRSLLTVLGIVLGVASVIVMLAIGEAARYQALKQLEDLGATTIRLRSNRPPDDPNSQSGGRNQLFYGVTYEDFDRISHTLPTVTGATPMREHKKRLRRGERALEVRIAGVTPEFFSENRLTLAFGRGTTPLDETNRANVMVLGSSLASTLFPFEDPIGRSVTIEDFLHPLSFKVVGVIEPRTLAVGGEEGDADYTNVALIPFQTDRSRFGKLLITRRFGSFEAVELEVSQLTIFTKSVSEVPRTASAVRSLIEQFHPRKDVTVSVPLDLLEKAEQTQRMFTLILGAIAGISLVVGGIGIMNIMLATVTERTREIGIRRALGATRNDIAWQFLVETLILSTVGGLIGVLTGVLLAVVVARILGLPTIVPLWSPFVAMIVSVLTGLASGMYPARRAAFLDPIEALRHE